MTNRRWIWFFVVLVGLSALAVGSMIAYNMGQQLKPEQLVQARELWRTHGPRSYQIRYTVKSGVEPNKDTYVVRVRDGNVVSSTVNERAEPPERFAYRGMQALLDDISRFQEIDSKPGQPRTFTRAIFDAQSGALRWYVRRVMGGTQRLEITVDPLEALPD